MTVLIVIIITLGAAVWACILWYVHPQLAWPSSHMSRRPHRVWFHAAQTNSSHHEELALPAFDPLWLHRVWMPGGCQAWTTAEPSAGIMMNYCITVCKTKLVIIKDTFTWDKILVQTLHQLQLNFPRLITTVARTRRRIVKYSSDEGFW